MGLFEKLFTKHQQTQATKAVDGYFKTLTAYSPSFNTYDGGIYEMELTRASIDRFATFCSKLKPEIQGNAYKNLEKILQYKPNPWQNTSQFLYRVATILKVNTTAFILPLFSEDYKTIVGFYPLLPQRTEVVEYKGEPWLRYTFSNGQKSAIELNKVGIMTQFQYKDDFFGDGNSALYPTLNLLDTQRRGIIEGVKQSAMIRFMAKVGQTLRPDDLVQERSRFAQDNLSSENSSGVMMFDAKYSEVKQIDSKPFIVDAEQQKLIQQNVYNYFGMSEAILQNNYNEEEWNSFYEGVIEPFAVQLSLVLTNMLFTTKELAFDNAVIFTSNRLQYASNNTKLQISSQLFDRGILTTNQIMDIWNMSHVENGDERYIRKEYIEVSQLNKNNEKGDDENANSEEQRVQELTDITKPNTTEEN